MSPDSGRNLFACTFRWLSLAVMMAVAACTHSKPIAGAQTASVGRSLASSVDSPVETPAADQPPRRFSLESIWVNDSVLAFRVKLVNDLPEPWVTDRVAFRLALYDAEV